MQLLEQVSKNVQFFVRDYTEEEITFSTVTISDSIPIQICL